MFNSLSIFICLMSNNLLLYTVDYLKILHKYHGWNWNENRNMWVLVCAGTCTGILCYNYLSFCLFSDIFPQTVHENVWYCDNWWFFNCKPIWHLNCANKFVLSHVMSVLITNVQCNCLCGQFAMILVCMYCFCVAYLKIVFWCCILSSYFTTD